MIDIREWLEQRGLGEYAELLVENEVDIEILPELKEADLEKIGFALGPRKKLLKAIRDWTPPGPATRSRKPRRNLRLPEMRNAGS